MTEGLDLYVVVMIDQVHSKRKRVHVPPLTAHSCADVPFEMNEPCKGTDLTTIKFTHPGHNNRHNRKAGKLRYTARFVYGAYRDAFRNVVQCFAMQPQFTLTLT